MALRVKGVNLRTNRSNTMESNFHFTYEFHYYDYSLHYVHWYENYILTIKDLTWPVLAFGRLGSSVHFSFIFCVDSQFFYSSATSTPHTAIRQRSY